MSKPLKCLLGFHDWDKPEYTRFAIIRRCRRCGKKKEDLIPPDIWLKLFTAELALTATFTLAILCTKRKEAAKTFLNEWQKRWIKEE